MTRDLRHDEEYDDFRTLQALSKMEGATFNRFYQLLRLMTRIKNEDADLWERIRKFAEEVRNGKR